ncbi:Uncharacterised protein [Mycobacteroides abscessus subsp. abscessus]|nr:Uncharacterised protein [Mycobacteroides abscessus subsp. abscessus]
MDVHPVGDQLDGHVRALQKCGDGARLAVVDRPHGIEQVGGHGCPCRNRLLCLLIGGIGMPHGGHHSPPREHFDRRYRARQLGCDGDHLDVPTPGVEQPFQLAKVRFAKQPRVVCPGILWGQPGAFEMNSGDTLCSGHLGEHTHGTEHVIGSQGDQTGQQAIGAV